MKKYLTYLLVAAMFLSLCGCALVSEKVPETTEQGSTEISGNIDAARKAYDALSEEDKARFCEEISAEQKQRRVEKYAQLIPSLYGSWKMETAFSHGYDSVYAENLLLNEDMTYSYGKQTGTWYFDEAEERLFLVNGEDRVIYFDFTIIEEDGVPKLIGGDTTCYIRETDYREAFDRKYVTVWGFSDASEYFGQPVYVGTKAENVGYGPNAKLAILDSVAYDKGLIYVGTDFGFEMELSWEDNKGRSGGQSIWNPFDMIAFVEGREVSMDIVSGAVYFVRAEYVEEIVITEDNYREVRLKDGLVFVDYNFTNWEEFPEENYENFKY